MMTEATESQQALVSILTQVSHGNKRLPQVCIRAAMSVGRRDLVGIQFAVLAATKAINEVLK